MWKIWIIDNWYSLSEPSNSSRFAQLSRQILPIPLVFISGCANRENVSFFLLINGKVACICIGFHCVVSFASCYGNDQEKITRERPTLILVPLFVATFSRTGLLLDNVLKHFFPRKWKLALPLWTLSKCMIWKKKTKLH